MRAKKTRRVPHSRARQDSELSAPTARRLSRPALVALAAFVATVLVFVPILNTFGPEPDSRATAAAVAEAESAPCGESMPYDVVLPEDFAGPFEGPGPDVVDQAETGQIVIHWLGRNGSIELRWPPNRQETEKAQWGTLQREPSNSTFLSLDDSPVMVDGKIVEAPPTVNSFSSLPTELMDGPCDAVQLDIYQSALDREQQPEAGGAVFAITAPTAEGKPSIAVYPDLPRPRDVVLVLETLAVEAVPYVYLCNGGQEADGVAPPPNVERTVKEGPAFNTPKEALAAFLATPDAEHLYKTGYFELVEPDGSIVYGYALEDHSLDPRPENGLVVAISVVLTDEGWTVDGWTSSGC